MRTLNAPMLLPKRIRQILSLLARQRARILDHPTERRALTEEELRERLKRLTQTKRIADKIDARPAAQQREMSQFEQAAQVRDQLARLREQVLGASGKDTLARNEGKSTTVQRPIT